MDKKQLKELVLAQVDKEADAIIALGERIYKTPETGFREVKTTAAIYEVLCGLGLEVESDIAVTGCRARANASKAGPRIAVMGELDSVICHQHPHCDKQTGAVHACGHHIQASVMVGVAAALVKSGALEHLEGALDFIAVPAEEYIELDYRQGLKKDGRLHYYAGKPELVYKGAMDDVDICMMAHNFPIEQDGYKLALKNTGNGFVGKRITFTGTQAHAGAAPWEGVNALNMAALAMQNIHAQRETFRDADHVRVHQIITKGGDSVNSIPDDVQMEMMVRASNLDALRDANHKVNRSIHAAAIALGGAAKVLDSPGYMPMYADDNLAAILEQNARGFYSQEQILPCMESTASFDIGDLSLFMPILHFVSSGIAGGLHTKDFCVTDVRDAFIIPVKLLCMTVIDLLFGGAEEAARVQAAFKPAMSKEQYLELLKEFDNHYKY